MSSHSHVANNVGIHELIETDTIYDRKLMFTYRGPRKDRRANDINSMAQQDAVLCLAWVVSMLYQIETTAGVNNIEFQLLDKRLSLIVVQTFLSLAS